MLYFRNHLELRVVKHSCLVGLSGIVIALHQVAIVHFQLVQLFDSFLSNVSDLHLLFVLLNQPLYQVLFRFFDHLLLELVVFQIFFHFVLPLLFPGNMWLQSTLLDLFSPLFDYFACLWIMLVFELLQAYLLSVLTLCLSGSFDFINFL